MQEEGRGGSGDLQDEEKGYKEQHDLVVGYRSDEPDDGDEQQEDAHRDDPSDDVDARHQAEPLPPCRYADQQQPHQLRGSRRGRERAERERRS